ncbi:MAG: hypothetical protein U1E26_11500 [Coriobacteriia bacterium]|nr:hypothetical protein [Coriobacteriia bacterium]
MKNWSIRTRILLGVAAVNLIGMMVVMVYLHESYSGGLDVTEQKSATLGVSAWNVVSEIGADEFGPLTTREGAQKHVESLKLITGAEYGLMLDKTLLNQEEYAKAAEEAGLANDWDERETYVLIATTDGAISEEMQLQASPDTIPEIGKIVGVENGACSLMCHGEVGGEGDFWGVRWSKDDKSRGHVVFPVDDDSGKPVGVVYAIEDISPQADSARVTMVNTGAVIIGGLLAGTIVIALMLNALVFRRLERMMTSIQDISVRVAGGDFGAHFTPDGTTDEIGRFEEFFARFMDLMAGTLKSLMK